MGYFKKLEIERMDNYRLREAEDFEDNVDIPMQPTKDTTWSIKHEKHLNKNNIIFHNNKYQKIYKKLKKVDDKLKESRGERNERNIKNSKRNR